MKDKTKEFKVNETYGYYEVTPKPTENELRDYYKDKYYQDDNATYTKHYELTELDYFKNKIAQKDFVVDQILGSNNKNALLEIGCGEGFTLDYYHRKGWSVLGVDFSDFGLKINHPHLKSYLIQGDIFDEVQKLVLSGQKYDLVWMDNILEHVIDPVHLIQQCSRLTSEEGVLVIEVPNDYSDFQLKLLGAEKIISKYWEAYPDHLTYFSYQSFLNLLEANGWHKEKIISDFPIEWYLVNPHSNYANNKSVGKAAHHSRMFIENFLHENLTDRIADLINLYEAMAKVGQGRQLIGFFTKK